LHAHNLARARGVGRGHRRGGDHRRGAHHPINREQVPGCTYCDPRLRRSASTEAKARRGYQVKVGKFNFSVLAKSQMEHTNEGFVKIVSDAKYDEVLECTSSVLTPPS
jgi:pyruvate/2-oxoglutarate dehydrogenase complex dihydrolipoamide dehydrogenase (E3) component